MPNVSYVRPELKAYLTAYETVQHCVDGEIAVKAKRDLYLPVPDATDTSAANLARYEAYLQRAQFVNFTRRTLGGLVGAVFAKPAVVTVPTELNVVIQNATGLGVNITQLGKATLGETLKKGRAGLFVDFPQAESEAGFTRAQLQTGLIRPTIEMYEPEVIINWRTRVFGSVEKISLVVLQEKYNAADDGFEIKLRDQWRVLRLDDAGYYVHEVWRNKRERFSSSEPRKSNGERFDYIPFFFIGSDANDPNIDPPPLYDIASLNIGHFRNSADYEESVFLVGQPTPYVTGLNDRWVKEVWKDGTFVLGSRSAIALPQGATAGLLQASPNMLPGEAMDKKERQMVALGAKLVQQQTVQRTATEAAQEESAERSTLSSSAENAGSAMLEALKACCAFVGIEPTDANLKFALNTDFELSNMSLADLQAVIGMWMNNAIAFEEMRENLRRSGIAKMDAVKAKQMIAQEMAEQPDPVEE